MSALRGFSVYLFTSCGWQQNVYETWRTAFIGSGGEKGGEEKGHGTPYLLLDLCDYRDKDNTLCRKISSHSQSSKGFSFFLEIPQTCPPGPSVSLSSGYELNPDTNGKLHFFTCFIHYKKRAPSQMPQARRSAATLLCGSVGLKVRGRERYVAFLNWWVDRFAGLTGNVGWSNRLIVSQITLVDIKTVFWSVAVCWDKEEERVIEHLVSPSWSSFEYIVITTSLNIK